jgi:hypothetical protein
MKDVLTKNLMSTKSLLRIPSKHITDQILSAIRDTWPGFRLKIKFASQNLPEDSRFSFCGENISDKRKTCEFADLNKFGAVNEEY